MAAQREAVGLGRAPLVAAACLTSAAALGLTAFFFAAKHRVGLARLAPFVEDPYDAVGSFGFQLALVTALISLLRGARRYERSGVPAPQATLVLRGSITAMFAVFVTIQADAVALLRHPRVWVHSPIGFTLTLGLVIVALASLSGAALLGMALRRVAPESRSAWMRGLAIVAASVALLGVYPETWHRAGLVGAIGTVFAGMAVLFAEVWALTEAVAPLTEGAQEDLLDDLGAMFRPGAAAPTRATCWLRARPWRVAAIVAAVGGVGLAASQAIGEGLPGGADHVVLVLGVFTGLETAAILFGYALFRRPLSLILDRP